MIERITEEEIEFMECWYNPLCLAECLFHDFDNLGAFDEEKLGHIRTYQIPMLSHEYLIDEESYKNLNDKEKRRLRKGAGDVYNFGGRGYGKSLITMKIDIPISAIQDDGWWCAFTSIDERRLRGILDAVKTCFEEHPIVSAWQFECKYKPDIKFESKKSFWKLNGVNMTLQGKDPGGQFFSLHVDKIWGDEMSFETEEVYRKRIDAYSERGAVERLSGMTSFTRQSPAGRVFFDIEKRPKLINLPQFVSPLWDEKTKKEKIQKYQGENTIGYRVFVKGEVVEEGIAVFDSERIRQCYLERETIKEFDISKNDFVFYKELLAVFRPKHAESLFMAVDIGETAPCKIVIVMKTKANKLRYLFKITLRGMSNIEIAEILEWLIERLDVEFVGIDNGDGTGRSVTNDLEKRLNMKITRYDGSAKIAVDFEYDENGNVLYNRNGEPQYKKEYMSEWSVQILKNLFYEGEIVLPFDVEFDVQFNSVVALRSGQRTVYKCLANEDHLFDAFKVLAITLWDNEYNPEEKNDLIDPKNLLSPGF